MNEKAFNALIDVRNALSLEKGCTTLLVSEALVRKADMSDSDFVLLSGS